MVYKYIHSSKKLNKIINFKILLNIDLITLIKNVEKKQIKLYDDSWTLINKKERKMSRGGIRSNAGGTAIDGKDIKLKIPNKILTEVEEKFTGKNIQDKLRDCLEFGVH